MERLYFSYGSLREDASPLISRDQFGAINGFLGVQTRSFRYKGEALKVANCHHFMATEKARLRLVPFQLMQHFLRGPQDLSFADYASDTTLKIWSRLGGVPVHGESVHFKIPLRPVSCVANHVFRSSGKVIRTGGAMLAGSADRIAATLRVPLTHRKRPDLILETLQAPQLLDHMKAIESGYTVFPDYDLPKLTHLLDLLASEHRYGVLQKHTVKDNDGKRVGWFIYYAQKDGLCEVIQAVSLAGMEARLFEMLTWHAFEYGGTELSGRFTSGQLRASYTSAFVTMPARFWTLMHTDRSDLLLDIHNGSAFFTRLEGDLWLL